VRAENVTPSGCETILAGGRGFVGVGVFPAGTVGVGGGAGSPDGSGFVDGVGVFAAPKLGVGGGFCSRIGGIFMEENGDPEGYEVS
jgi:hypothetical protein